MLHKSCFYIVFPHHDGPELVIMETCPPHPSAAVKKPLLSLSSCSHAFKKKHVGAFQSGQTSPNVCQRLMNQNSARILEMITWNAFIIEKSLPR